MQQVLFVHTARGHPQRIPLDDHPNLDLRSCRHRLYSTKELHHESQSPWSRPGRLQEYQRSLAAATRLAMHVSNESQHH
ncbi:hypothetical protein F441_06492 [Phytophthora nicotianae CJ01A1]|uniref:Uncharacterized protein n=6 Tax=Phytophthora nicotianae TaxID=4792 RepID=W2RBK0_PHYN3|nr:hypothetical protein PPTG_20951 [Phytophthora nicotianae INRA-310]ETI49659.1 hypothetical protein F443_06488 [Phytophthora nicotianae P1569]ETK89701.1 hypothetical protein L915_06363 [Phytophthora nicotianae]ETO78541.1 hypothetical protein F444_06551 [Phytophthora nicotianae P1976]ETP19582.1 hypothetical protein F441_06492 [Phytophthora nicotianae CJ01A1]ETP47518.1 hypothetical protein F442_06531 [Phytophthora nicotianae P10297]